MKKTTKRKPDALDRALRRAEAVGRIALRVRAVVAMPTGTPALDAAQDAAMASVDRAVARLQRQSTRGAR